MPQPGRPMLLVELLEIVRKYELPMDTQIRVMRDRDVEDAHTGDPVYPDECAGAEVTIGDGYSVITFLINAD